MSSSPEILCRKMSSTGRQRRTLPPELLVAAVRRLRVLAFVVVLLEATFLGIFLFWPLIARNLTSWTPDRFDALGGALWRVGALAMPAAAGMIALTYSRRMRPERILMVGLGFQILIAYLISATDYHRPWIHASEEHGIPVATLWIMAFPLLPSTLHRSIAAAFGAAAMGPLAMLVAWLSGHSVPDATSAVIYYTCLFLAALIVVMASSVIYRLAADVSVARRLGSYELIEKLGSGGMGEVWRARHGSLVRPAAVKMIRREILGAAAADNAKILARFEREAQSTAALRSPNTVALYDFGRTAEGTIYYVMELLGGIDLDALVQQFGPLPPERVVHVLQQVCHSLREAHSLGLVHRDIKPANLQLTIQAGDHDVVKVLDFGLVKRTDEVGDAAMTGELAMLGTPAYAAPEQAIGRSDLDGRTDLYALGCVAYYLLTGNAVFPGDLPMQVVLDHMQKPPIPPSELTDKPIPPALEGLVLELLAKSPDQRPASAADLARRLAAIPLATPWTADRAEAWWRDNLPAAVSHARDLALASTPRPGSRTPTVLMPEQNPSA